MFPSSFWKSNSIDRLRLDGISVLVVYAAHETIALNWSELCVRGEIAAVQASPCSREASKGTSFRSFFFFRSFFAAQNLSVSKGGLGFGSPVSAVETLFNIPVYLDAT